MSWTSGHNRHIVEPEEYTYKFPDVSDIIVQHPNGTFESYSLENLHFKFGGNYGGSVAVMSYDSCIRKTAQDHCGFTVTESDLAMEDGAFRLPEGVMDHALREIAKQNEKLLKDTIDTLKRDDRAAKEAAMTVHENTLYGQPYMPTFTPEQSEALGWAVDDAIARWNTEAEKVAMEAAAKALEPDDEDGDEYEYGDNYYYDYGDNE